MQINQKVVKGIGYEGECMERFMSSRIDTVEENLRTAALRAKLREVNKQQ